MERRYSLINIFRKTFILAIIVAVCLLCSCKQTVGGNVELSPGPRTTEDAGEAGTASPPPDESKPPEVTQPDEAEPLPPKESDEPTDAETQPPEVSDTPVETDTKTDMPEEYAEPDSPWNRTTNHSDSGEPREYPAPDKIAYITIDDGPTRQVTPQILDILKDEGIRATFFVLPHSDVEDLYRRILDEGHVIGNHSYSHKYKSLYAADTAYFREDLLAMHDFLYNMLGYTATLYRFPGGAMGRSKSTIAVRVEILEEYGYSYFDWNSSTGDSDSTGEGLGAQTLIDNVLNKTNGRKQLIVLMHDSLGKQTTVEALPYIIDGLREQGYAFDTLDNYG